MKEQRDELTRMATVAQSETRTLAAHLQAVKEQYDGSQQRIAILESQNAQLYAVVLAATAHQNGAQPGAIPSVNPQGTPTTPPAAAPGLPGNAGVSPAGSSSSSSGSASESGELSTVATSADEAKDKLNTGVRPSGDEKKIHPMEVREHPLFKTLQENVCSFSLFTPILFIPLSFLTHFPFSLYSSSAFLPFLQLRKQEDAARQARMRAEELSTQLSLKEATIQALTEQLKDAETRFVIYHPLWISSSLHIITD